VSSASIVSLFAVGASLLGFWAVLRFPAFGPQSVQSAMLLVVAIFVLQSPFLILVGPVNAAGGPPAALLVVVLPSLVTLFWSAGCLVRSLATLVGYYRH
jgi:hypothetical protein